MVVGYPVVEVVGLVAAAADVEVLAEAEACSEAAAER